MRNVGSFAASDVRVNPSAGYLPAPGYPGEPFTLKPGEESVRDFVTQTGYLNAQPPATLATVDTSKQAVPTDSRQRELTDKVEQARTEAPANTCLRREGPTNATAFTVSWKADPGTMNNWLAILIGLFVALLIGYVFWRGTPAKGK